MADARLEREFGVTPEKLFRFVSGSSELMQWFGPEGVSVPDNALDFSREGPWYAVMTGSDGPVAKVSGHVTHVDPPRSVGFTWAWHDENDVRGHESHVTFTVEPTSSGARLIVDHKELSSEEAVVNHKRGWESSFNCLAEVIG